MENQTPTLRRDILDAGKTDFLAFDTVSVRGSCRPAVCLGMFSCPIFVVDFLGGLGGSIIVLGFP
jgi:hypothetical protein